MPRITTGRLLLAKSRANALMLGRSMHGMGRIDRAGRSRDNMSASVGSYCFTRPLSIRYDPEGTLERLASLTSFSFEPKAHCELGTLLGIRFEKGVALAGARFTVLFDAAARLERSLINFLLDVLGSMGTLKM